MSKRMAVLTVATILSVAAVSGLARPAAAQGLGLYFFGGATSQGYSLELWATAGVGPGTPWTVYSVRLSGAEVRCARSTEVLDLSADTFTTSTQIKTAPSAPFTIARLTTDDDQVALLITGQATSPEQLRTTLTAYWSHLYYAGARDTVPTAERCTAVLPVTLQLIAVD